MIHKADGDSKCTLVFVLESYFFFWTPDGEINNFNGAGIT